MEALRLCQADKETQVSDRRPYRAILLFGNPGSGKGTQGQVLGQMPNLMHLAMGDIFRSLDKRSDIGKESSSYASQGLLVPDDLTVRVWREHVEALIGRGTYRPDYHTLLLDGIPRTTPQVELMGGLIEVRKIIHLVIENEDAVIARLSGRAKKSNRRDDADPAVIRKRIAIYKKATSPVLDSYNSDLLANINADQHPLAVLRDIAAALEPVVSASI